MTIDEIRKTIKSIANNKAENTLRILEKINGHQPGNTVTRFQ